MTHVTVSWLAVLGALAGASLTGGVCLVVAGLVGTTASATPRRPWPLTWLSAVARRRREQTARARTVRRARLVAAPLVGLAVWLAFGWLVAGLITAAIVLATPSLLGTARSAQQAVERLEALQAWTRRLADLRTAGGGLEQTLTASLKTCPAPIRPDVAVLVARLRAGWRVEQALRAFADDLADPAADLVVAVLVLDAERRGAGVAKVLDELADTVSEEVAMRRKVEADRAKPRTSARIVTAITLTAAGIGALNPTYIAPYGTPLGQLLLAVIAAAIGACLWWTRRVATGGADPRTLQPAHAATAPTPGEVSPS